MSPSALTDLEQHDKLSAEPLRNGVHLSNGHAPVVAVNGHSTSSGCKRTDFLLDRNLHKAFPVVTGGNGNYLYLQDGRTVFDATSGAAVSCLGHNNKRVIKAISTLMHTGVPYLASTFWACEIVEELCKKLIDGTDGKMARVYLTGSGKWATSLLLHVLIIVSRLRGYGGGHQACSSGLLRE